MQPLEPTNSSFPGDDKKTDAGEELKPHIEQPEKSQPAETDSSSAAHPLMGEKPVPSLQPFKRTDFTKVVSPTGPQAMDIKPAGASPSSFASETAPSVSTDRPETTAAQPVSLQPATETAPKPVVFSPGTADGGSGDNTTAPASPTAQASQQLDSQDWFKPAPETSGPVVGGGSVFTPAASSPKRRWFGKKPLVIALAALVVVGLAGGYVFAFYIPNKPENVFKTGLSRTGMAADQMLNAGTQKSKLDSIKKIEISGNLSVTGPDGKQSGSFSSHYDETKSDSTLTYTPSNGSRSVSVQALTDMPSGQTYPDIYFKVTGLSVFGLDQMAPELMQYDSKWINISPAFLQSVVPPELATPQTKQPDEQLTPEDSAELTKAVVSTTRDYVFTNDQSKNVLVNKKFKGKEKIEAGITADRYEVGINKQHAKDYCKALITSIFATKAIKHIPGVPTTNLDDTRDSAIKSCQEGIDSGLKDSDSFDMWVSTSNKLINKVRVSDAKDAQNYVEFGQTYTKGSVLPVFFTFHDGKQHSDSKLNMTMDMDKGDTALSFNGNFGSGNNKYSVKADASFKPYKGDINLTKPSGAVPIDQVFKTMGIDPSMFSSGYGPADSAATTIDARNGKAQDTERKTDLRALQGQLEAYYASNGNYPSLSEINSPTWRHQNMKGLDDEALADPVGKKAELVATATATQYGYAQSQCQIGVGCVAYTLTSVLSDGSSFKLDSFGTGSI